MDGFLYIFLFFPLWETVFQKRIKCGLYKDFATATHFGNANPRSPRISVSGSEKRNTTERRALSRATDWTGEWFPLATSKRNSQSTLRQQFRRSHLRKSVEIIVWHRHTYYIVSNERKLNREIWRWYRQRPREWRELSLYSPCVDLLCFVVVSVAINS